jgi:thiamine-phosphate pyrophosphorylase
MTLYRKSIRQHLPLYLVLGLDHGANPNACDIASQALRGGVTMLQLREKNKALKEVLAVGRQIRSLCREYQVPFIVNDRIDLAMLLDADGVHVGQDDIPYIEARKLLGDNKIIGVSAGTLEEAEQAAIDGADYLGVGAIYATATKADAGKPIGTSLIREIHRRWNIPQVGIGGINADNVRAVIAAGADGAAVVSAISDQLDPYSAAMLLRTAVLPN